MAKVQDQEGNTLLHLAISKDCYKGGKALLKIWPAWLLVQNKAGYYPEQLIEYISDPKKAQEVRNSCQAARREYNEREAKHEAKLKA